MAHSTHDALKSEDHNISHMLRYQGVENKLLMKINTQSKDCMKYFRKGLGSFWALLSQNTWNSKNVNQVFGLQDSIWFVCREVIVSTILSNDLKDLK